MGFFDRFFSGEGKENADLEKVMREMSVHPDMKARRVLYLHLMKSTLLLPTPKPLELPADGSPLKDLQLVTRPGRPEEVVWLAFTSRQALHLWREQFPEAYVAMVGSQVFALAVQNRVDQLVINPAGPVGGYVTRRELQMLAEGTLPMESGAGVQTVLARRDTPLQVGPLTRAVEPSLMGYFREHLLKVPEVREAYLAQVIVGGGVPHLILGLFYQEVPSEETVRPLMTAIGQGVGKHLGEGEFVDMVPLDDRHEWASFLKEKGTRVYQKE